MDDQGIRLQSTGADRIPNRDGQSVYGRGQVYTLAGGICRCRPGGQVEETGMVYMGR